MKIGCIVMAAGNARRFGSNKLDARVEGKTLLRRALEAVPASCFARVAVVTQYPQGMELAREMGFLSVRIPGPTWDSATPSLWVWRICRTWMRCCFRCRINRCCGGTVWSGW